MVDARADQGRARDGEDPGDNDATRDAPTNGGKATRGADADNGASDRVRCTDGNAELGVHDEREAAGGLRSESAEGRELGDALAHRLMMRQPPAMVPPPMARWQTMITQ